MQRGKYGEIMKEKEIERSVEKYRVGEKKKKEIKKNLEDKGVSTVDIEVGKEQERTKCRKIKPPQQQWSHHSSLLIPGLKTGIHTGKEWPETQLEKIMSQVASL